MRPMLKSLLASVAFIALTPQPASALPRPCEDVCTCNTSCSVLCTHTPTSNVVISCAQDGVCIDLCRAPSQKQASVSEETEQSDDTSAVCEEQPAPVASAES
ncbi:hypothetical protein [Myxococcus sp. RHSTA-1-4]|uniref:hypothetical protein n=1 Tax=Myxococcus sp. RHSTA-1-4 TaxID=2874601 RepID=UPI001CBCCB2B|nr:hypothetical protein [Myxococcus sp. RHSTA-1-4]MBZ4421111.1 hypothetical protein [Myxococcus sp. RHSTA-1-4]